MHRILLLLIPASAFAFSQPVVPEPSTISMFAVAAAAGGALWLRGKLKGKK